MPNRRSVRASLLAPRMWPLSFDRAPLPFTKTDFSEDAPTVTVFGNLVDASQGKAESEAVLGNGRCATGVPDVTLPKSPLTYFLASEATPPHQPELKSGLAAACGRGSMRCSAAVRDQVYIVREDAEARSYVQFGDGETGATADGLNNVVARFRSGKARAGRSSLAPHPLAGAADRFRQGVTGRHRQWGADREDPEKGARPRPASAKPRPHRQRARPRDRDSAILASSRPALPGTCTSACPRCCSGAALCRSRGRVRGRARRDRPCAAVP